ncbi:hypothetical protein TCAL_03655 [Tigriopus californicus]|uniref:Vacuolar protein sorting-associated protein 11 homolog n=1 Tax=Tigriopus californicus TaxID=6832 RepID=A0A553NDQ4_TIGCA|nr:vacuolar protein sorting-associated protein 11 homolog [Tigriopus californicus]TRY63573.1 hypothetical protein TCAL_03655 [Tigriopus californicus]
MTFFQWKRFNFFEIAKDTDGGAIQDVLKDSRVLCSTAGRGLIILGDSNGCLHFLNRHLEAQTLSAFPLEVLLVQQVRQSGLLLALGLEERHTNPVLRVYHLDILDKLGQPSLLRHSRVGLPPRVSQPTCLAAHDNQALLAVGFQDGILMLYRGEITRERGTKSKVLMDGQGSLTGCFFRNVGPQILLYVTTKSGVFTIDVTTKDKEYKSTLDSIGCPLGTVVASDNLPETHMVTARDDGVYCYNPEGRGQCYAFDGRKTLVHWFRTYLVVVTEDSTPAMRQSVNVKEPIRKQILTIFDVQNKFVAFTAPIKPVTALVSDWGLLFALTEDNRLCQLTEKDIQTKLDMLFRKNFYDVAVKVAKSQHYDEEGLIDIFRQYGDHLYSKNDLTGAVENYSKTIGHLDPSYVIRKFLDTSKTIFLTEYLQALHSKNLANEDHTTLLLNCYTKLKDKAKLDEFVLKDQDNLDFDVDIAIRVCRQAGYHKHAIQLAKRHHRHELYLKMQIEDLEEYGEALDHIADLDFPEAERSMKRYGNFLMRHLPSETTSLLQILCTDYRPKNQCMVTESMLQGAPDGSPTASPAENFIHLFVQHSEKMVEFLEYVLKYQARLAGEGAYNTLLEHYLHQYSRASESHEVDRASLYEEQILRILKSETADYDHDQALILCQLHSCRRGLLQLYTKKELYHEILKNHVEYGEFSQALQTCRQFGSERPELWTDALKYVASDCEVDAKFVNEVLETIEQKKLMSPLMVIKQLSNSPRATLGMVREFLLRVVQAEDAQLSQDKVVVEQYRDDSVKLRHKLEGLQTKATVFQASTCSACSHPLELPSVHFLCEHSYHQHCFQSYSETETDCPSCYPENKKVLDIIKSQEKSRDQHDLFHHQLNNADDSFSVIAEYFGRGVFRPTVTLENETSIPPVPQIPQNERVSTVIASEARQRINEGVRSTDSKRALQSEGRLRSEDKSMVKDPALRQTEGQLRRNQGSSAQRGIPTSDARLRQAEGGRTTSTLFGAWSGSPKVTKSKTPSPKNISGTSKNPFGNASDDEDLGAGNPFSESNIPSSASSKNPFGDPDYDEGLNPFGTS